MAHFQKGDIKSLSIYVTTLCNYRCEGCCAHTQAKNNITVEEIRDIASNSGKVKNLFLTGGEPTLHKKFRDIMPEIAKINHERMILATNGWGLIKYIDLMDMFSEIRISHYDKKSYPDAQENTKIIEEFKRVYKGTARIVAQHITMIPHNNGRSSPCPRGKHDVASYFRGNIYGCCVGGGMDTAIGLPFDKDWRETAKKAELPCKDCVFAV